MKTLNKLYKFILIFLLISSCSLTTQESEFPTLEQRNWCLGKSDLMKNSYEKNRVFNVESETMRSEISEYYSYWKTSYLILSDEIFEETGETVGGYEIFDQEPQSDLSPEAAMRTFNNALKDEQENALKICKIWEELSY